jgi:ABC-type multidrug transport system ATPase subunit
VDVSGHVTIDGNSINPALCRQSFAYVMQHDALMATATPRESLRFSAMLRLQRHCSLSDVDSRVQQTISALYLDKCADTCIGDELMKGISGGERKRTAVGIELITNPSLIFLDEPISGLDAFTGFKLVQLLGKIAASNASVLLSIHQPSSEIFYQFDRVIFLKQGRILFQGNPSDIVLSFSEKGYKCPDNYNPADFVMFVCQTESLDVLEAKHAFADAPVSLGTKANSIESIALAVCEVPVQADFFTQLYWITYRELINTIRNKQAIMGRFGVVVVINIIFSILFLRRGDKDDSVKDNFDAHFGAVTMIGKYYINILLTPSLITP